MEYIFALFPLLFFSSPPFFPPPLSSRRSFSRFAASFGRTQRSLGSKWKRASKELCTRFRHVRYSCVLLYHVTFFLRGFHGSRERNTGGLVPLTPTSTEWRLSPKFLFLPLPFTFFHFSFISFSSFFPLFLFFFFRRSVPFSRSLCARAFFPFFFSLIPFCFLPPPCLSLYVCIFVTRRWIESSQSRVKSRN